MDSNFDQTVNELCGHLSLYQFSIGLTDALQLYVVSDKMA
jgi:hypothetical protein